MPHSLTHAPHYSPVPCQASYAANKKVRYACSAVYAFALAMDPHVLNMRVISTYSVFTCLVPQFIQISHVMSLLAYFSGTHD